MIVFYGRADDSPLSTAIDMARNMQIAHVVLDMVHLERDDMFFEIGEDGMRGYIVTSHQRIHLADISAVYARPLALPLQGHDLLARTRAQVFQETFMEWLDVAPALIVNRPFAMESNSSKPFQSQAIAEAGFAVPDTLVTNDPAEVREFWQRHGRVIFKSVSGIRSIVQELDPASVQRLEHVKHLPTQFQAYVPGVDIRVHVVGEHLFATQVESAAVDYRYAGREGLETKLKETTLPHRINAQCIALSQQLGLPFCGIDLRCTPEGDYVCFEVNPMPAYSYYEASTKQPISQALVELLARNDNHAENHHDPSDRKPDLHSRADFAAETPSPTG